MIIYIAGASGSHLTFVDEKIPCLDSYFYLSEEKIEMFLKHSTYFFLDSGAFSAFTKNKKIDIDKYIKFIHKYKDRLSVYSVLDDILDYKKTEENQRYMESKGLSPNPCYHYGEPLEILEKMVDEYEYISIGGMVPISTKNLYPFLDQCFDIICDTNGKPKVKVHGFGMTIIDLMKRYPWYSVDSTSAIMYAAMGNIINDNGKMISISQNKVVSNDVKKYVENRYNYSFEEIRNDYKKRCLININYFLELSKELTNNPPRFFNQQNSLF